MRVTGEPDAVKAARPVRRGADGKVLRATGVTRRRPTLPLTQKVREAGRIVNVSVVVATAVNGEGKREIIGMDVGTSEDGAFWLAFLRSLSARGLGGVKGGEKVFHCGGGIVYHRHDEKELNWEPGGVRSGAGVRRSGLSQESSGSSETW